MIISIENYTNSLDHKRIRIPTNTVTITLSNCSGSSTYVCKLGTWPNLNKHVHFRTLLNTPSLK